MSEMLMVRSRFKNYHVDFIDDFEKNIKENHFDDISFFIIDTCLLKLYEKKFSSLFNSYRVFSVEATEHHKTMDYCQTLIRLLIEEKIRKNCTLVAVGGGVIQDITAFISSILFRGVRWVFYPTTLLAQADSCIGSKTSINFGEYKNLLGSFYPPSKIYIDIGFLETLPKSEIKSGIGEILHFYLIGANELSEPLMNNYDELIDSPRELIQYITESLKIKKRIIEIDEFDRNKRNLFNYGHTFGHAIETVSGYEISHGEAVTMGMDMANYISLNIGYLNKQTFDYMHGILEKNIPSFSLKNDMIDNYFEVLSKDKKNIGNNLGCILTGGPGAMTKVQIPFDDKLKRIILSYFKKSKAL